MDLSHSRRFRSSLALGISLTLMLAGCAMEEIPESSPDFGDAVRHTIALQTGGYGRPTGLDAIKAENALREYQKNVAKPTKSDSQGLININLQNSR